MGVIEAYVLFATSVALWSCYELMRPALSYLQCHCPEDHLAQNPKLAYFIMFCVAWIVAPVMVVVILSPTLNLRLYSKLINPED